MNKLEILKGQAMGYMFMYVASKQYHYLVKACKSGALYRKQLKFETDKTKLINYKKCLTI